MLLELLHTQIALKGSVYDVYLFFISSKLHPGVNSKKITT